MGWRLCWTVREDSDGNYTDVTNTGGIIDRQDLSPTLQTDGHTHTSVAAISWRAYSPSFKKKKGKKLSLPKRSAHMATTIHLLLFIVVYPVTFLLLLIEWW